MSQDGVTRIRVGDREIGIAGLSATIEEVAEELAGQPEERIRAELLKRLCALNYVPPSARSAYEDAFFEAFQRLTGDAPEESAPSGVRVKILGTGCTQCTSLAQQIMEVVAAFGLDVDVEHVTDIQEIARHGVTGMPVLMINGEVKCVGRVPDRKQIEGWLLQGTS